MCIQYKDDEIGGACSTHGDHEICKQKALIRSVMTWACPTWE